MPEKILTRNKAGGWDKKSEALPSEIQQKKQGLAALDNEQSEKKSTEKNAVIAKKQTT